MTPGMRMPAGGDGLPSSAARLVCGDEIRGDVRQLFGLASLAAGRSTWAGRLLTCTYVLSAGNLRLSVHDATDLSAGRAYFDAVRTKDGDPPRLRGLQAFGLPAFETRAGRVVFLKDGKTLTVDATGLPRSAGPNGQTRTAVAYAVAADVIGCWSE